MHCHARGARRNENKLQRRVRLNSDLVRAKVAACFARSCPRKGCGGVDANVTALRQMMLRIPEIFKAECFSLMPLWMETIRKEAGVDIKTYILSEESAERAMDLQQQPHIHLLLDEKKRFLRGRLLV